MGTTEGKMRVGSLDRQGKPRSLPQSRGCSMAGRGPWLWSQISPYFRSALHCSPTLILKGSGPMTLPLCPSQDLSYLLLFFFFFLLFRLFGLFVIEGKY